MTSPCLKPFNGKKLSFTAIFAFLIVLVAFTVPVVSLTVYDFKIKDKEIDYGEKLEISIVFVGDGALRIKNANGETVTLFTLKKGGEYTYEIDTEGLLYPGDYYAQVLDENGNEVVNESFKVISTYTVVVVTIGEEKKARSYLYDILIVPTTLKPGNNSLDIFFSSNTYSKGGAEVYLEVPEGWSSDKVKLDEVNFKNHVVLNVGVPESAYGSYILTLHVDTTFGKFNKSFAVSVEEGKIPTPTPTPVSTPTPTPTPTSTPTPTPTPVSTPTPTPTPVQTVSQSNVTTMGNASNITGNASSQPTPETPATTPGFEVYFAVLAFVIAIGIWVKRR